MPSEATDYLRRYSVPDDIIDDLGKCCFTRWLSIGPFDLVPMVELVKQTTGVIKVFEQGYAVVAGCRNFDPIAVDVRTRQMVYVRIPDLVEYEGEEPFDTCLIRTPLDYDQFWQVAASEPDFPSDSYEAEDRWPRADEQG